MRDTFHIDGFTTGGVLEMSDCNGLRSSLALHYVLQHVSDILEIRHL